MLRQQLLFILLFTSVSALARTQPGDSLLSSISSRYISAVSDKAQKVDQKLHKYSTKTLAKLQKQEEKMKRQLARIDSLKAKEVFGDVGRRYGQLKEKLAEAQSKTYIPSLDSMTTSLMFLDKNKELVDNLKNKSKELMGAMDKVKGLKDELGKAEQLQAFIDQRKNYLIRQLKDMGFAKQLTKLNKQAYYYSQQVSEYKAMLKDYKKAERKALDLLSRTKMFKDFMRRNSQLASMFRMPGESADPASQASLTGLQARAQVNGLIQQQIAAGGPNAQAQIRQNIQEAQSQLNNIKNKMNQLGGSNDKEMPEGFRPNQQKTKSLKDRLEYGANIQSQKSNQFLPVTSDIGLSLGYKLNDKSVVGIGASYKLGWGENIRAMKISHQGLGLRSYIDWKLKGSFWISGGYEQNYRSAFQGIEQLQHYSAWQQSGLIGISKQVSLKTRLFRKTNIRLLWDFLSYQQVPRSQPILFRVGYNL